SSPQNLTSIGGSLLFAGSDGRRGNEPGIYVPAPNMSATANGGGTLDVSYETRFGEKLQLELKAPNDSNYRLIQSFAADPAFGSHTFSVTGLQASTHYLLRLKSIVSGHVSYATASSDTSSDSTNPTTSNSAGLAPTNLAATVILPASGSPKAQLVWDNNASDETGFTIKRKDLSSAGADWITAGTTLPDVSDFLDTPPDPTHVYQYKIVANFSTSTAVSSNVALVWFAPLVSAIATSPSAATQFAPVTLAVTATPSNNIPT